MSRINLSTLRIYQIILMILFCTAITAQGQQFYFKGDRNKDVIPFTMVKNLIIIPLYLNEKGPFNFILDTGVGPMIITDPSLIDSIGLKVSRSIKISGLGKGNEIDAYISNDVSAQLGKAYIDEIPTAILKEDIFGLSNYLDTKIYGLLGYYFFKSFIVELRYSTKKILFKDPGSGGKIKGERVPIEISAYKPYANITIENEEHGKIEIKTLIDNGASHAISLERLHEQPFPVPPSSIKANLGVGMSGPIDGCIGRISALKIGSFTLKRVLASYPKYDDVAAKIFLRDRNGNLGADVLSRFNVVFDYADNSMYLRKNSQFTRPFEHDMSGIELYVHNDKMKRYFVSRIEPDSPAQKAGVLVDDEIVTINLAPVSTYKLNDINNLFKSANGKTIILSIMRNNELMVKVFKLKQRI
ncbi:MAG: aspartyl protease family protein [Candidatus Pedobacter colombiensis]|uniref:Aspartyl protease family protein n=1 Tax=Candidatus Pedobacter colombiensis TaxID=3121371 RepID=A0AAJ5W8T2_9SPHI|nr:aspartyl protease family protein [Pedobacter sp.]WEK19318.1 MAG: aspartyl protease family protein [Pedobacter sp.]